jgi:hypothetical protein
MRDAEEKLVRVSIAYDAKACPATHPLSVTVLNGSGRKVLAVDWSITARMQGRSTDIADYNSFKSDIILGAGESYSLCYELPRFRQEVGTPASLEYSVKYSSPDFAD